MVALKIGIVYAVGSRIVRRIVLPDDDAELPAHPGPGEALLSVAKADLDLLGGVPNVKTARALLAVHLGQSVPSGRCAVVNGTNVVAVIMADPALDSYGGGTLISSDTANVGDTYDPATGIFTPPPVLTPL